MKLLYFYPGNPLHPVQGNNARALSLLEYFRDRNIQLDFVGEQSDTFTEQEIGLLQQENLVKNGFLIRRHTKKTGRLAYLFRYSLYNKMVGRMRVFFRAKPGQQDDFEAILKQNSYDFILITYACWASLVTDSKQCKEAKRIVDTHDFLTAQFQKTRGFELGKAFQTEMALLSAFDTVLAISPEEKYLFSQFTKADVRLVTHALDDKSTQPHSTKKYDLVYVGSDNEHNRKAADWFFEKVFPLLDKINMVVVGKIAQFVPDYPNVEKIPFAPSLDTVYQASKIALCPMLSGTGLKIKVIEALSYGLPVVCNEKGTDGLVNKTHNGCLVSDDEKEFAAGITRLIEDSAFYAAKQQEAKQYFQENHSKSSVYAQLDSIFNETTWE